MKNITTGLLLAGFLAGATSNATEETDGLFFGHERSTHFRFPPREKSFQRVGTFANYLNNGDDAADETVSEIVAATADGNTLVYTDGVRGTIGFIDITNPAQSAAARHRHPRPQPERRHRLQSDLG